MVESLALLALYILKKFAMVKIIRPASKVQQGNLILYTTSLRVSHLLLPEFYSIERLDPENQEGYQRLLNKTRAKKLADYIVAGLEKRDAFLPTSIFMATDKDIPFDSSKNEISIDTNKICPLSIVDGQHRVEGLKMAAEKDERVNEFEVPVNIAVKLDNLAQMAHFLIVNTTQKSVDEGIAQRIRARMSSAAKIESTVTLPRWIDKLVEKGEDDEGLQIVDYLNTAPSSPWKGRIVMANEESPKGKPISQKSFVALLKKYHFVRNNPILNYDIDKQSRISENFWKAITGIIGAEDSVIFKYIGVQLFLMFSCHFFVKMLNAHGHFKVDAMLEELQACFEAAEGEATGIGHADYWKSGGKASGLNSGAVRKVSAELFKALHRTADIGEDV